MDGESLVSDAIKRKLAEVDQATGKTSWEKLMETIQEKAASGDTRFAKLLTKARAIEAEHPEFKRSGEGV